MFKSFYSKLSTIFLILVLMLGTVTILITFSAASRLFDQVEQTLNRDYSRSIADELQPIIKDGFSQKKVGDVIHYMMVLNPIVEIYLTDDKGYILAYFVNPGDPLYSDVIDIKPVKRFLLSDQSQLILGDDPRSKKAKKPFSAAKLNMGDISGYVYVILRGKSYDRSIEILQNSYYIRTGIITFFIALIITIIIGFLMFFILTRRLSRVTNAVLDFSRGDYKSRVNIGGSDEISFLANTYNKMADSIEDGVKSLKKANKDRNDLMTNISHDLRSPLTSIRGHLETLMERGFDLKKRDEYVNTTLKNILNFQDLVDKLFDLAKLENSSFIIKTEPINIPELIQDIVLKVRPEAKSCGININLLKPRPIPMFIGDIGLIERMVSNLIENSIKYCNSGDSIDIMTNSLDETIIISITDTGPGIDKKDIKNIFNRFYKGTLSKNGTGLGLSIVKEIITIHKGDIKVTSPVTTKGVRFDIYLPIINY